MFQAAKFGDLVIGIDTHMVMVPAVPSPVPVPMPHVFIGIVFDPLGGAINAAVSKALGGGGPVWINGLPAANTGTDVRGLGHSPTPPGTAFAPNDIPGNDGTLVTGSKTVKIMGASAARMTSVVVSCNYPVNLPTSMCLAFPGGAPTLIGGPTAVDYAAAAGRAVRTKWFSNKAHSVLKAKPGSRVSKAICFVTGHPVDVMTGEVLTDAVDFTLPGPIPLVFERNYYSRSHDETGPLGAGWHHPLDAWVDETEDEIKLHLPDGRERLHDRLAKGDSEWDEMDRYTLRCTSRGYCLTTWNGQSLYFERVPKAHRSHPLVRIMDRCENVVELHYERGRLAEVTDSAARKLAFSYTPEGRIASIRLRAKGAPASEAAELVRYGYNEEGFLADVRDRKGKSFRYRYQGGVLTQETNRNGLSFYFEYDRYHPDGDCIHTWGDGGIYERWIIYDHAWHNTEVKDSRGGKTLYWGNAAGLVEKMMDATTLTTRYEWHRTFQKSAEIDEMGNRTEWDYDERGNQVLMRDALKHETRVKYNELNLPVEVVDPSGGVRKIEWDARGRLKRTVDELGNETRYRHDARGNVTEVEDAMGRGLSARYGDAGLPVEVVDREAQEQVMEWDLHGRLCRHVDALGGETVLSWDACGNLQRVRRPDGSTIVQAHDAEGNTTERTDALGNTTRYRYAGFNQLVEQIDPAGGVIRFAFDTEENLVGVTNEHGEEYKIEVDLCGRPLKEIGFDGRETGYRYDRAGRCSVMINAFHKRTKIERDPNGRVIKRVIPRRPWFGVPIPKGEEFMYAYDACGRLIQAKNATAEVSFKRDARGDVIEERMSVPNGTSGDAGEQVIESRYDAARNCIERRTSLGHSTQYDFDGNGEVLGVVFGVDPRWLDFAPDSLSMGGAPVRAPWKAMFARNAAGVETERRLPGGVVSRWERDRWGRPQVHRLLHEDAQLSAIGYQWHTDEQLAALIDTAAGPMRFTHDERSYLVAATRPDGSVQYRAPDPAGNIFRTWDRKDRAYGPGGRLVQNGDIRHVYNVEGQLIQKVMPDGSKWEYDWDWGGRLESVTAPDGKKVTFGYDPLERRVRKTCGDRTTVFVWDGDVIVHEVTEGEPLITWEFEPATFAPIAKIEGDKRYSIVTDHLGTPQAVLDHAGEVVWKGELDLYGVLCADVALVACPWRWPGQYEDAETGLVYNRFRYYDPQSGSYISQDPIGLLGGFALYAYVPDLLLWIDPLGLKKCGVGPYGEFGGHHIHAKAAFRGHELYKANEAISISIGYMEKYKIIHDLIGTAQRELFIQMGQLRRANTMAEHSLIAIEALVRGGASRGHAVELVEISLENLLKAGVTKPTRIPWVDIAKRRVRI